MYFGEIVPMVDCDIFLIANGKFFYLRINSFAGGNAGHVAAKVKVTNLSAG